MKKILVAGAGGFIGGHLVKELVSKGNQVRAVDIKPLYEWYQVSNEADNLVLDLRLRENCFRAVNGYNEVFNLAADMGGMGFIENNKAACMLSVLINTHLLIASRDCGVDRFFYASSACVYNGEKQTDPNNPGLRESDAYPALPEDGYGWEKLFSERMCRHFSEDFGLTARTARFHNVYGPYGTFEGGREKAPAAICRKVIEAGITGRKEIEIWGDGQQTRSFMYIDDCTRGIQEIMYSEINEPINLGSSEMVSINRLVDIVEDIAGYKLKRTYDLNAPKGVRGRNSDNSLIRKYLGWEPSIPLATGLKKTFDWISTRMTAESIPDRGLPHHSSSGAKRDLGFPYRLCLAGGWIDQPWVSKIHPGSVVVAQIRPQMDFNDRSGLATSSRKVGIQLWGDRYPDGNHELNARLLFGAENPPGKEYISGSQDHIGLLYPGINRLYYAGDYWPEKIDSTVNAEICDWLSEVIYLVPLEPRPEGYNPLRIMNLEKEFVKELGDAGDLCWHSILSKDIKGLGKALTATFFAWKKILPLTVPDGVMHELKSKYFPNYPGAIISGSGGGYVVVVSDKIVKNAIRVKIRY